VKCPFCGCIDNKVIDSRLSQGDEVTRRRRECDRCTKRYTTYERVEQILPMVVKKDGRREPFDRLKVMSGLQNACQKRPVPLDKLETLIDRIEQELVEAGEKEIESSVIGEKVMAGLKELDQVAYVRFASVSRSFKDIHEFMTELTHLLSHPKGES